MENKISNKGLVYKECPVSYPEAGRHLVVEPVGDVEEPKYGITIKVLYASYDPYIRGRLRDPSVKSYVPAAPLGMPIENAAIGEVVKTAHPDYKEGDLVIGHMPIQEYVTFNNEEMKRVKLLQNPLKLEDVRNYLGALGMPGLTAYSSLYEIGQPKKGETIFISAASGAVGQIVGQLAKREGLKVIGSVGSDEKLKLIMSDLKFDGGFNYKKEKPMDALQRLAPQGIDIYFESVGGEHLEAAIQHMNDFGRIIVCGMISQYNTTTPYPIKNIVHVIPKRLTIRGFIVQDPGFGPKYAAEHQKNVAQWIKEGSIKTVISETNGIDNAATGLIGIFHGENLGKAVLKL